MRGSSSRLRSFGAALGALVVVALAIWLPTGGQRLLRPLVEGRERGARRALAAAALDRRPIDAGGARLRLERLRYRDPLVTERDGGAEAVAVADGEGTLAWRGRDVAVTFLGRERLEVARCPGEGWCVRERLPRLGALLSTLLRRAEAFDRGDGAAYGALVADDYAGGGGKEALVRRLTADLAARPRATLRPVAWQIRIERDTAQVGEDYEVAVGDGPPRRLRARLGLRDEGGRWRFTDGL